MSRPVLSVRLGVAGSGKTLSCVIFACTEFLPFETGRLISNLPFLPDKIAERYEGQQGVNGPMSREEIAGRFESIPKEVLDEWKEEQGGPWEYFKDRDIVGSHIMIDEAHNFVGQKMDHKWRKKWQQWVGELRHVGATIELITQAEGKLAKEFKEEAERQVIVSSSDTRREPIFGIEMGDIYQLLAKAFPKRGYRASTWVCEKRASGGMAFRRFVVEKEHKYTRHPHWFELYESHNEPHNGGVAGRRKLQYEMLSWPAFLKWFLVRNIGGIVASRFTKGIALAAIMVFPPTRNAMVNLVKSSFDAMGKKAAADVGKAGKAGQGKKEPQPTLAPEARPALMANRAAMSISDAQSLIGASPTLDPQDREQLVQQLEDAKRRFREQFEKSQEFVGVLGDDVLMRNGDRYAMGETIGQGRFAGRHVVEIDRKRREVVLDDKSRVKYGRMLEPVPPDPTAQLPAGRVRPPGTGFPKALPRVGIDDAQGTPGGGAGPGAGGPGGSPSPGRPVMGFGSIRPVDRSRPKPVVDAPRSEAPGGDR